MVAASSVPDLIKIIDVCVSENMTKVDAKMALNCIANKLEKLSSDECETLCNAASTKIQPKILLFAFEVRLCLLTKLFHFWTGW